MCQDKKAGCLREIVSGSKQPEQSSERKQVLSAGEWIHVCVWLTPFVVHPKLSHCQTGILQYKIKRVLKKEVEKERKVLSG